MDRVRELMIYYINETFDWTGLIMLIMSIHSKVAKRLGLLKCVKHLLPRESRKLVYKTMTQPILMEYGDIVWVIGLITR